jgi:hypothetical protein
VSLRPDSDLWHAADNVAVSAYLFSVLRYTQVRCKAVWHRCLQAYNARFLDLFPCNRFLPPLQMVLATAESTVLCGGPTVLAPRPLGPLPATSSAAPAASVQRASIGLGADVARLAAAARKWLPAPAVLKRAARVALAVLVAAIVSAALHSQLQTTYSYWAPLTCAFVSAAPEGGDMRIGAMRIQSTVMGSIFGYLAVA